MRKMNRLAAAALAVVMAASVMAMPVFAAQKITDVGEAVGSTQENGSLDVTKTDGKTGTAKTDVKVIYSSDASQLSVTVPISVTFAVQDSGKFVAPTNYTITNNSRIPVHVTTVAAAAASGADYTLVDAENSVGSEKKMWLSMKPKRGKLDTDGKNFTPSNASETVTGIALKTTQEVGAEWDMDATGEEGNALNIEFDGKVGAIQAAWANAQVEDPSESTTTKGVHLFTITYTIEAGKTKATN